MTTTQQVPESRDHLAGFVMRGKKWNPTTQTYESAAFLNIYIYDVDSKGEPIINGKKKLSNGIEVDNLKVIRMFRVPLSTLTKVVSGEAKRCQMFWQQPYTRSY